MLRYLFSFKGRINRAKLWLWLLISTMLGIPDLLISPASMRLVGPKFTLVRDFERLSPVLQRSVHDGMMLFDLLLLWPLLALTLKRLHDRNKGPVWLLPFWLFPYVFWVAVVIFFGTPSGSHYLDPDRLKSDYVNWVRASLVAGYAVTLWAFIELYCMRGTYGANRFGPDPLASEK